MVEKIIELLNTKSNVDEYQISINKINSTELFFIKDNLDMTRGKDVKHISITIFRNFDIDGKKYKGSSTTNVSPTMTIREIEDKINIASLAASFVQNEHYKLVEPTSEIAQEIVSKFNEGKLINHISNLVKTLFSENTIENSFINSCEFFINNKNTRIINSNGVDVSFNSYSGQIELVTESKNSTEEVELFQVLDFSDLDENWIKDTVKKALQNTLLRASATPLPDIKDIPIILTGNAVKTFFSNYLMKSSGQMLYNGLTTIKIGESVQGEEILGDKVNLKATPFIENSTASRFYDQDGFLLKEVELIENGILKNYIANKRFADYLKINPTGSISNTVVGAGSKSVEDLMQEPHLQLLNFSDFQMDPLAGNFGGEIRLGIYFDGVNKTPITLGSISGNVKNVQGNMYFSKELQRDNNFIGPKIIKLENVTIAGNK